MADINIEDVKGRIRSKAKAEKDPPVVEEQLELEEEFEDVLDPDIEDDSDDDRVDHDSEDDEELDDEPVKPKPKKRKRRKKTAKKKLRKSKVSPVPEELNYADEPDHSDDHRDDDEGDDEDLDFPTGLEISKREIPPVKWAVEDFLVQGFTILAGVAKIGKSTFLWQLAKEMGVEGGGKFLGRDVEEGKVLFITLEEYDDMIQERMEGWSKREKENITIIDPFDFVERIGYLYKPGAIESLVKTIRKKDYRLVVIDPFSKAFLGLKSQDKTEVITAYLEPLHALANVTRTCVVMVDHHGHQRSLSFVPKNPSGDVISSSAKGAVIDSAIGLYNDGPQGKRLIMVLGRRVRPKSFKVVINPDTRLYELLDFEEGVKLTPKRTRIVKWIHKNGPATLTEIANGLGTERSNLQPVLKLLVEYEKIHFSDESLEYNA